MCSGRCGCGGDPYLIGSVQRALHLLVHEGYLHKLEDGYVLGERIELLRRGNPAQAVVRLLRSLRDRVGVLLIFPFTRTGRFGSSMSSTGPPRLGRISGAGCTRPGTPPRSASAFFPRSELPVVSRPCTSPRGRPSHAPGPGWAQPDRGARPAAVGALRGDARATGPMWTAWRSSPLSPSPSGARNPSPRPPSTTCSPERRRR